jgi:hypothetical protein
MCQRSVFRMADNLSDSIHRRCTCTPITCTVHMVDPLHTNFRFGLTGRHRPWPLGLLPGRTPWHATIWFSPEISVESWDAGRSQAHGGSPTTATFTCAYGATTNHTPESCRDPNGRGSGKERETWSCRVRSRDLQTCSVRRTASGNKTSFCKDAWYQKKTFAWKVSRTFYLFYPLIRILK